MLAALAGLFTETVATAATASPSCEASIPTQLVGSISPPERPVPICRRCQVVVAPQSTDSAELRLSYFDEESSFAGYIEIVVWLASGVERIVAVPDVVLHDSEQAIYALAPGSDWNWSDVIYAWVEFVPEH